MNVGQSINENAVKVIKMSALMFSDAVLANF
jgi:hypothetical protein